MVGAILVRRPGRTRRYSALRFGWETRERDSFSPRNDPHVYGCQFDTRQPAATPFYADLSFAMVQRFSMMVIICCGCLCRHNHTASASLVISPLVPPEPNELQNFRPESNRWINDSLLVCINVWSFPDQVGFFWSDHPRFLDQFPDDEERRNEELHRVLRKEVRRRPWHVTGVPIDAGHQEQPDGRYVSTVRLEPPGVRKLAAVETLLFTSSVEKDVGHAHNKEVDEACVCISMP